MIAIWHHPQNSQQEKKYFCREKVEDKEQEENNKIYQGRKKVLLCFLNRYIERR